VNSLEIIDSSSAVFDEAVVVTSFTNSGKSGIAKNFTSTAFVVRGATLTGAGAYVTTSLSVLPTAAGALNTALYSKLVLTGQGTLSTSGVTIVFFAGADLTISAGATLTVSAPANFNFQSGPSQVSLEGTLFIPSSLHADVDIIGKGAISVSATGSFDHTSRAVTGPSLSVSGTVTLVGDLLSLSGVSGGGLLNVSASLATRSALGPVSVGKLNVFGGPVSSTVLQVSDTLSIVFGDLRIITSATIGTFIFSGGTISADSLNTTVSAQAVFFEQSVNKILDTIIITTKKATYNCPPQTVLTLNGSQVRVDA